MHILSEVLRHAKTPKTKGLIAVQLDISKAFDTIPHDAIEPALTRKGILPLISKMICKSYKNMQTQIHNGPEDFKISLKRGVKQDDPLSPFISNAVMEPLLLKLESIPGYKINENTKLFCLAFSDDLILTAKRSNVAQELLQVVETFFRDYGLSLSVQKCASFQVVPIKDSFNVHDPKINAISGEAIPYPDAKSKLRYLGMDISLWYGIDIRQLRGKV